MTGTVLGPRDTKTGVQALSFCRNLSLKEGNGHPVKDVLWISMPELEFKGYKEPLK
jgi:hypothetical protein